MRRILLIIVLLAVSIGIFATKNHKPAQLSPIITLGNQLIATETQKPIVLKGVTSDYFRYSFNYNYPEKYGGLEEELKRVTLLKSAGPQMNVVALYLASFSKLKENITELDQYIEHNRKNGLYTILAPAGIGFLETNPKKSVMTDPVYWSKVGGSDLRELTQFLAERYGKLPYVLFYLTAEPNLSYSLWEQVEATLAQAVRQYSENPIILSTPYYEKYPSPIHLSGPNLIYSVGGYVRKQDGGTTERTTEEIVGSDDLKTSYPVIVSEFGGNYGDDYSSKADLDAFKQILNAIQKENLSNLAYRLSAKSQEDGLALFNTEGHLSKKGRIFLETIR